MRRPSTRRCWISSADKRRGRARAAAFWRPPPLPLLCRLQFLDQGKSLRPHAKTGRAVDVSLRTDIDEPTAPRLCEPTGTAWRDVLVIGAHHDDAPERQFLERHRSEAGRSSRVTGRFNVARRDQQRPAHLGQVSRSTRPVRDERAAQAVRSKHYRQVASGYCRIEGGHPVAAPGSLPVTLENSTAVGAFALPVRLPVLRTGVPQAGDEKNVGHGKPASLAPEMRFT